MGQRGYRKHRRRCRFIDRQGLQCRNHVKQPGSRYCSRACWARARTKETQNPTPGAHARREAGRQKLLAQAAAVLAEVAPDRLVALTPVLDTAYQRGYEAATFAASRKAKHLRMRESRSMLEQFLGSHFGKQFVAGKLSERALTRFRFGGSR